jgi:UrcA family protein
VTYTPIALAVMALIASAAQARPPGNRTRIDAPQNVHASLAVKITDLDLSKPADVWRLHQRVEKAARIVCEGGVSRLYLQHERTKADSCYALTIANALAQANETIVLSREAKRPRDACPCKKRPRGRTGAVAPAKPVCCPP